jgi:DNA-binding transcriptional LysR family regulator
MFIYATITFCIVGTGVDMAVKEVRQRVKLRHLEALKAVIDAGGIGKAAGQMHLSQPAVSKAMSELEDALGVPLIERGSHGAAPTRYGLALARGADTIFEELARTLGEIRHLADPGAGELHFGCMDTLNAGLAGVAVERLLRRYPRMNFRVESGDAAHLTGYFLRERICEFVLARPYHLPLEAGLAGEALFTDRLRVVVGGASPFARRRRIGLRDLVDEAWILSGNESGADSPVVEGFAAEGLPVPACSVTTASLNIRYNLLASGRFVTVMPHSLLHFVRHKADLRVLPVDLPRWRIPTMIITLKDRKVGPVAELFLKMVRELAGEVGG